MEKREYVELFAFAFLPHIKTCGREKEYENLHTMLVGVFEESTAQDVLSSVQSHYNCLGLKCDDVGRHVNSDINMACLDSSLDLLGYSPVNATKTNMVRSLLVTLVILKILCLNTNIAAIFQVAKLDLDAVAIYQLMSVENYDASKKIYLDGYNYYDYDDTTYGFISLYDLTQSSTIGYTNFSTYSLYSKYLEESPGDFAHSIVIDAFEKTGKFQTASGNQRREAVMQVISSFISYISSLEALHFAVNQCDSNSATAITAWDGGAALLIGSIEGEEVDVTGGSSRKNGYFMYSLSKLICNHFDTCIADGTDSEINKQLLEKLTQGQTAIQDGLCRDAEQGLESIKSLLVVPLIQSILYYVDKDSDLEIATVAGYVSTMALSPIIDAIDSTSSETIEAVMTFPPSSLPSGQNKVETVYNAFRAVLSDQKSFIDCQLVSTIHSMCDQVNAISSDVESFNIDEPTTMSNGLYIAKNFVGDRSAIAKDIADIQDFLDSKDVSGAKFVYDHGENSKIYNENGMPSGKRSISSFSVNAGNDMRTDPTYNLFVYGLSDENDYLGKSVLNYADSFVNLLFDSSDRRLTALAPEAMVSLHVWMQVAHKLHTAYAACKESIATSGRQNMAEISDPSLLIDEAAAYWIGDNQSTGSSSKGHLLYALTELIGEKFETMDKDSQSSVNSRIIDLFNQAKNHVAISDSCSTSEDSHLELRKIVTELIPMMAIPLLRCLYYYLSTGDNERVKLYAVSVLPLFSHCSPSTFLELKNDLIDHDIDELDKEYIFSRIQSLYDCLGLTCDVVGYMPSDDSTRCDDSGSKILAGYDSRTDRKAVVEVRTTRAVNNGTFFIFHIDKGTFFFIFYALPQAARVDVDARAIDIFINNGIYLFNESEDAFAASYECYKYGHSIDIKSSSYGPLHSLATNTNRDVIPSFSLFRRYFNNDDDYADSLIVRLFFCHFLCNEYICL